MPDLIIKPTATSGNKLILKSQDDTAVLTTSDSGVAIVAPTIANMTNCTFPSGKVNNVFRFKDTSSGDTSVNGTTTQKVGSDPWEVSCVSGRHYVVTGLQYCIAFRASGTLGVRSVGMGLYYGTTSRTKGADLTGDTKICQSWLGRVLASDSSANAMSYCPWNYHGSFTAGADGTHYVYTTVGVESSGGVTGKTFAEAGHPHVATILEVMP